MDTILTYVLKEDGTITCTTETKTGSSSIKGGPWTGTYTVSGNKVTVTYNGQTDTGTLEDSNTMIVNVTSGGTVIDKVTLHKVG
jgi:hypothetical protein